MLRSLQVCGRFLSSSNSVWCLFKRSAHKNLVYNQEDTTEQQKKKCSLKPCMLRKKLDIKEERETRTYITAVTCKKFQSDVLFRMCNFPTLFISFRTNFEQKFRTLLKHCYKSKFRSTKHQLDNIWENYRFTFRFLQIHAHGRKKWHKLYQAVSQQKFTASRKYELLSYSNVL